MVSYNIKVVLTPLEDIQYESTYEKLSNLISYAMTKDEQLKLLHEENTYKMYCFCSLYPYQDTGVYKLGAIYQFDIRTLDLDFAIKIKTLLTDLKSEFFKVIMVNLVTNEQRNITELRTLTPCVITTTKNGYKIDNDLELVKERLLSGAEKKYKLLFGEKISHDFIDQIEQTNRKPIKLPYKNIHFLANKFVIKVKQDELSQKLAYILFATGALEKNSLGMGFCTAK